MASLWQQTAPRTARSSRTAKRTLGTRNRANSSGRVMPEPFARVLCRDLEKENAARLITCMVPSAFCLAVNPAESELRQFPVGTVTRHFHSPHWRVTQGSQYTARSEEHT